MINDILATRSRPSRRPDQHPPFYSSHFAATKQTTAVRYAIDDDLWKTFTFEQVTKQIRRLRETGRFWPPHHGSPFTVRLSQFALSGEDHYTNQIFYDFSFEGGDNALPKITVVTRHQHLGSLNWTTPQRRVHEKVAAEALWDEAVGGMWWEKDYLCVRCMMPPAAYEEFREIASMAASAVVVLLQDRTANKIEIEPRTGPKLNLPFLKRRPKIPDSENLPEIILTIPRRVYTTTGTGKPHGPHRMHYRAEHIRRQPIGPRSAPSYKEIVIPGMWISAKDVSPSDLGTPITRRNYRFEALRKTEK